MTDVSDPASAERLEAVAPDESLRRREFLERTARTAGVGLGVAAALGPDRLIAAAPAHEGHSARLAGRPTSSIPQARRSDASQGCKGNERRPG